MGEADLVMESQFDWLIDLFGILAIRGGGGGGSLRPGPVNTASINKGIELLSRGPAPALW